MLVGRILDSVVRAVDVPVTLKIRTGPAPERRNALRVARIAESAGVQMLAVHGRTRACMFEGRAEHDTVREVKAAVRIPVIANGDITCAEDAKTVLEATGRCFDEVKAEREPVPRFSDTQEKEGAR